MLNHYSSRLNDPIRGHLPIEILTLKCLYPGKEGPDQGEDQWDSGVASSSHTPNLQFSLLVLHGNVQTRGAE